MSGPDPHPPTRTPPPRAPYAHTIRNGCVCLALLLLIGLAVVQTVAQAEAERYRATIGRTARAVAVAAAQAAVGFALALGVHRLLPRAGLWLAVAIVGAASYAAAVRWSWIERAPYANMWAWIPFTILLALSALDAIPKALHEAAAVDRARPWFKFKVIILPLVAPLVLGGAVFRIADSFRPADARRFVTAHVLLIAAIVGGSLITRGRR